MKTAGFALIRSLLFILFFSSSLLLFQQFTFLRNWQIQSDNRLIAVHLAKKISLLKQHPRQGTLNGPHGVFHYKKQEHFVEISWQTNNLKSQKYLLFY